jgi:GST-like protein
MSIAAHAMMKSFVRGETFIPPLARFGLERELCLLKEIAEGTYKTKHAEAARLILKRFHTRNAAESLGVIKSFLGLFLYSYCSLKLRLLSWRGTTEAEDTKSCSALLSCSGAMLARLLPAGVEPSRDLVLYAADTPNSWKPAGLLEELGVEYDVVLVDIAEGEQKKQAYTAINPNGRTPTLVDRSVEPHFAVFESNAILLYLATKLQSPLLPSSATGRSEVEQWLMWQISALGPMMGQCMYMKRIATCANSVSDLRFSIDRFHAESLRLLGVMDERLKDRDYLCGPGRGVYTLADLACYGYVASYWWAGLSIDHLPALQRWLVCIADRPAVARGVKVPGVSVLGPKGVIFASMFDNGDPKVRSALEASASAAGRPYFNWMDMKHISATEGPVAFVADARPAASQAVSTLTRGLSVLQLHNLAPVLCAAACGYFILGRMRSG